MSTSADSEALQATEVYVVGKQRHGFPWRRYYFIFISYKVEVFFEKRLFGDARPPLSPVIRYSGCFVFYPEEHINGLNIFK